MPTKQEVTSEVPQGVCLHKNFHASREAAPCGARGKVRVRDEALLANAATPDFLSEEDNGHKPCASHYALSFLIPFLSVSAMYSYDVLGAPFGYVEALGGGLLAGMTGWSAYGLIKFLRHRKVAIKT